MWPRNFFSPSFFPDRYWFRPSVGAAPPAPIGQKGAAPALHRILAMMQVEQEHRSLVEEQDAHARFSMALKVRMAETKMAFDREVERRQFHSIYSLLVSEL